MLTLDICDKQNPLGTKPDEVDSWLNHEESETAVESNLKHVIKFQPNDQYHPKSQRDNIIVKVYNNQLAILELERNRVWSLVCEHLEYLTHTDTCLILKFNVNLEKIDAWRSAIATSCSSLLGLIDVSALTWVEDDGDEAPESDFTRTGLPPAKRGKFKAAIPNLQVFRIPDPYRMGSLLLSGNSTRQYVILLASEQEVARGTYKTVGYNDKIFRGFRIKEYAVDELKTLYKEPAENELITALNIIGERLFWCTRDALRILDLRTGIKIGYVKLKDQMSEELGQDSKRYILKGGKSQIFVITATGCIITIRLVAKSIVQGVSATMAHVCGRDHLRFQIAADKPEIPINVINQCFMMEEVGNILVYYDYNKVGIADSSGCIMAAQEIDQDKVTTCHGFSSLSSMYGKVKIYARLLSESEQIINSLQRNPEGSRLTQTLKHAREWLYKTDDVVSAEKLAELLYTHQQGILLIDASILGPAKKAAYIRGSLRAAANCNQPISSRSSYSTHEVNKYFQRSLPLDTMIVYLDMQQENSDVTQDYKASTLRSSFQQWPIMSALIGALQLTQMNPTADASVASDFVNSCVSLDFTTPVSCSYFFLLILNKNPSVFGRASSAATSENMEKYCQLPYTLTQHVNRLTDGVNLKPTVTVKSTLILNMCSAVPTRLNHLELYCRSLYSGTQDFVCTVLNTILKNHSELLAHIQTLIPVLTCYTIFTRSFEWSFGTVLCCAASPEGCQIVLSFLKDMFRNINDQSDFRLKTKAEFSSRSKSYACDDTPNLTFLARARRAASNNDGMAANPSSPNLLSPKTSAINLNTAGERISPEAHSDGRRNQTRPQGLARRDSILTFAQPPAPKPVIRAPTDRRRFHVASPTFLLQFPEDVVTAGGLLSTENWLNMTFNADTAVSLCCFGVKIGKITHVFEILLQSQFMLWAGLLLIFGELHDSIGHFREALRITGCHNKKCAHYEEKLSADSSTGISSEDIQEHLLAQGRCALNLADIVSMILDDKNAVRGTWEYELVKACSDEPKVAAQNFFSSAQATSIKGEVAPREPKKITEISADQTKKSLLESSQAFSSLESDQSTPRLPSAQWNALEIMQSIFNLQWSPYSALRRISTVAEVTECPFHFGTELIAVDSRCV